MRSTRQTCGKGTSMNGMPPSNQREGWFSGAPTAMETGSIHAVRVLNRHNSMPSIRHAGRG
jgi:hypothetical protein